ncbi:MAG: hypothetical protein JWO30_3418 [Fibrobacteres bacterium]|nr:hypothetical protein [Fibrobacterota bacterium]
MMDLSPIANAIKSVQAPPPQAQPSIAEEMKPVPQAEIDHAVPALPAKGGEPGLGKHLDLYDTEVARNFPPQSEAKPETASPHVASQLAAHNVSPKQAPPAELTPDQPKADAPKKEKRAVRTRSKLLGYKTGLPQPTTDPIHLDLPFLKPLGGKALGRSIDARI